MRCLALMLPLLVLAACVAAETPATPPPEDACGAQGLQSLVGRPASVLETMKFAGPMRILRPGMAVTMDYSANRLNIAVDKAEVITGVACG